MSNYQKVMSNKVEVKAQYGTSDNLVKRMNLHDKYSVNKLGLHQWLFQQYAFSEGMNILELGSGTGELWQGQLDSLPHLKVTLSDYSEGMVQGLATRYKDFPNVTTQMIDISAIPYDEGTFDVIIANFMLYHVPDLTKALAEVKRVLKPTGIFYCATVGERHLIQINQWVKAFDARHDVFNSAGLEFTLQKGHDLLDHFFTQVKSQSYVDHLEIRDKQDLLEYIESFKNMSNLAIDLKGLSDFLENQQDENGMFFVEKESGTFICRN